MSETMAWNRECKADRTVTPVDTTIYALASGAGVAGVAVVRLSGPAAGPVLAALTNRPLPAARYLVRRRLYSRSGAGLDDAMVAWFPAPRSFTGEDIAELHLHGGPAVLEGVFAALADFSTHGSFPGLRPAGPGEFSRRAFANGKMDLTAAEGLVDLVAARTEAQRQQALNQMRGALTELYDGWRSRLTGLLARLEADIDFADEDLPDDVWPGLRVEIGALAADIGMHLADNRRGEALRDGFPVTIVGRPNAGKSSLFNRLAGREMAIVAQEAGTTRDVVEARLDLAGIPVTLKDTAGLRHDAAGAVEMEGIRRTRAAAAGAALVLVVAAPDCPAPDDHAPAQPGRGQSVRATPDGGDTVTGAGDPVASRIYVWNKQDLAPAPPGWAGVSALTGHGIQDLLDRLGRTVHRQAGDREVPAITRLRHRMDIAACHTALLRAMDAAETALQAEDLRLAIRHLGRVTGRVDVEAVLDDIFSRFCIGK